MNKYEAGTSVVEFALALLIFSMFLLGLLDFARMLYTWNAATEATRAGTRFAVVCDDQSNDAAVLAKMQALLPQISAITVSWDPAGCNPATCEGVSVQVTGLNFQWLSPLPGPLMQAVIPMPGFSTYLPREMMRQDPHSGLLCDSTP
jgi:hypothetical protein